MHISTPINYQCLSGDKIAFIACEKNDGSNQILGLLQST